MSECLFLQTMQSTEPELPFGHVSPAPDFVAFELASLHSEMLIKFQPPRTDWSQERQAFKESSKDKRENVCVKGDSVLEPGRLLTEYSQPTPRFSYIDEIIEAEMGHPRKNICHKPSSSANKKSNQSDKHNEKQMFEIDTDRKITNPKINSNVENAKDLDFSSDEKDDLDDESDDADDERSASPSLPDTGDKPSSKDLGDSEKKSGLILRIKRNVHLSSDGSDSVERNPGNNSNFSAEILP